MRTFFSKIKFCFFVVLIGLTQLTTAQECGVVVHHLDVNPVLVNAANRETRITLFAESERPPLKLPFFDDFSNIRSPFPNDSLWEDNMVFINASFPLFPPTIGVATFDALDANGRLYEHASSSPFGADTLTSRPIRLDSIFDGSPRELTSADSVFFSFYFQPGGGFGSIFSGNVRGRAPRRGDLLILEFRNDAAGWDIVWISDSAKYWSLPNVRTLESFCPLCVIDTVEDRKKDFFRQVAILVPEAYFHNGFQFRFRNISSLDPPQHRPVGAQNGGQWHIDYVRLNAYPNGFNRFLPDIAFVHQGDRVLRYFQAMPANQFQGQEDLVSQIPILFRNLDTIWHTIEYNFQITGPGHFWSAAVANTDVEPFYTHGFNYNTDIYFFQRNFQLPSNPDSGVFYFHHILTSINRDDINRSNDTMIQTVHFGNYFAYDDGTPEAGFGFSRQVTWPFSEFAYRFPLRVADSLVAIQIWLNHTTESNPNTSFNLAVWSENNGNPSQNPIFEGERLFLESLYGDTIGFFTYWLDAPLPLDSGDFFIGFQQDNNFFLNIGFDLNNNASNRMFRRFQRGQWQQIYNYGSVMMRPVFGTSESIPQSTNILDRDENVDVSKIRVFPNPSDGTIFVESPENVVNRYEIFDLNGRRLLQRTINSTQFSIDLPQNPGFYILVLYTENGIVSKRVVRR